MTHIHRIDRNDAAKAVERYRELTGDSEARLDVVTEAGATLYAIAKPYLSAAEMQRGPYAWGWTAGAPRFTERLTAYLDGLEEGKRARLLT